MKVLLATDGSKYSEIAVKTLIVLKPPSDTEVFILHVIEPQQYLIAPMVPPPYNLEWNKIQRELEVEAEQAANQAVEQAEQMLAASGIKNQRMINEGDPASEIIDTAKEIKADLMVVGSKGLSDNMAFMLGSVSQKVLRYAQCPVLVVRQTPQAEELGASRVVLATDGSKDAMEAAEFLSSFHLADNAEITLMTVVQQLSGISRFSSAKSAVEQIRQSRLDNAQHLLEETQDHLTTEAKVTTVTCEGDPAEQILKTSSEKNADLIVVGSKGLGGVKMFLIGSVSQKICRYSDRSVLLVKTRTAQ